MPPNLRRTAHHASRSSAPPWPHLALRILTSPTEFEIRIRASRGEGRRYRVSTTNLSCLRPAFSHQEGFDLIRIRVVQGRQSAKQVPPRCHLSQRVTPCTTGNATSRRTTRVFFSASSCRRTTGRGFTATTHPQKTRRALGTRAGCSVGAAAGVGGISGGMTWGAGGRAGTTGARRR